MRRRVSAVLLAFALAFAPAAAAQTTDFARLSARLSEPGGTFDTDNLVSNETSYLHVMGALRQFRIHGGAYLGVGPEQNFSYIAEIEPDIALLIDIRRDNLLLHLLFKAMFETADSRMTYLCLLFGRPAPPDLDASWQGRDLPAILAYLDRTPLDSALHVLQHEALMSRVASYGIPLSADDRTTLRRFHDEFASRGLDLTFTSLGRMPRRAYPTVRRLYLETDLDSNLASYLSTDQRWQRVRRLQLADRIVPVVGDLAGAQAMRAIAAWLRETHHPVSAVYLSNVEMYLFRAGTFPAFAANVRALPTRSSSLLIRSWFGRGAILPNTMPGHFSTQLIQSVPRFLTLTADPDTVSYWTLVTDGLDVRPFVGPPR